MRIVGVKSGHDGAVAVIEGRRLVLSFEAEKDSHHRHAPLTALALLEAARWMDGPPEILAVGGWHVRTQTGTAPIGAGYFGSEPGQGSSSMFMGRPVTMFHSSHERSHIMTAVGMAPQASVDRQVVLVWEGDVGAFYLLDGRGELLRHVPVLSQPGARYALVYAIADPTFPERRSLPRLEDAGKLMALAAYGSGACDNPIVREFVDRLLAVPDIYSLPKAAWHEFPLYNAGVESPFCVNAAAYLSERLFAKFRDAAIREFPGGLPLRISGGCGLNCDWNSRWRRDGHFSSVFVPPCPDDSGSAIGAAIDALYGATGDPHILWSVYSGLEFVVDSIPSLARWRPRPLSYGDLANAIAGGHIVAWVQGRWEIGPRALGHRSILAEPSLKGTRDRLNAIKERESFRPIAPCCHSEDVPSVFSPGFDDPFMLYFQQVNGAGLDAIAHVDLSARVQSVTPEDNAHLFGLLAAFRTTTGRGVLCNTSLNRKGHGFINRMSDLLAFGEERGLDGLIVGDTWYVKQ